MKSGFIVILALALPLGAQTVLRVAVGGSPATFDPHVVEPPFPFHAQFLQQIFESPLETRVDAQGLVTVVPGLCELPEISADGLTVTLRVARGARFHDDACFDGGKGRAVVARDVAYAILRHADPGVRSSAFPMFVEHRFKGVDAWREKAAQVGRADYDAPPEGVRVDGDALVLELAAPYPQLRALLTQPWASVVPHEAIRVYGSGFGEHPVGTGPFRLADVDATRVRLVRNPGYRIQGLPRVDEVRLEIVPDVAAQAARYLARDLDVLTVVPAIERQIVDPKGQLLGSLRGKGHTLVDGVPLTVSYVAFNVRSPILGKVAVREALTLALDREAVARESQGPRALRADHPLPQSFPEAAQIRLDPWPLARRDVAKCKDLLAKAGFGPGAMPQLILDVPASSLDPCAERAAEAIVAQLGEAGVPARLRIEPFEKFSERAAAGDFHLAWVSWYADYPDAENFLLLFRSDKVSGGEFGSNYGGYASPVVDELYRKVAGQLPGNARTADVTTLLRQVRADCAWIPLAFPATLSAMNRGVEGYRGNVLDFSLRDVGKKP
jgi:peptide/nickel transport system substrate-binding protein